MSSLEGNELPQSYLRAADGVPPVRVLVVDDEPDLADLVSTALRFDGCRTATAGDADEAIKVARELRPDIAVLDMMLPGEDGVRLLARLRAEHPDLPAVFLTARSDTRDRIAGLRAGADDYISKPFSLEEVVARLRVIAEEGNMPNIILAVGAWGGRGLRVRVRSVGARTGACVRVHVFLVARTHACACVCFCMYASVPLKVRG